MSIAKTVSQRLPTITLGHLNRTASKTLNTMLQVGRMVQFAACTYIKWCVDGVLTIVSQVPRAKQLRSRAWGETSSHRIIHAHTSQSVMQR